MIQVTDVGTKGPRGASHIPKVMELSLKPLVLFTALPCLQPKVGKTSLSPALPLRITVVQAVRLSGEHPEVASELLLGSQLWLKQDKSRGSVGFHLTNPACEWMLLTPPMTQGAPKPSDAQL